ncbi:MAG: selenide, water dikinase SelD [Thiotrichales bacterium]|nr:selenide, water dikinase SelD [Thiotrichales bacterium]
MLQRPWCVRGGPAERREFRERAVNAGSTPIVKDLVLAGGGHSHVIALKRFGMRPIPGVRITLICRDVETPYSGMLPGHVAGHYAHDEIHIDLGPLARFANARFYHDEVIDIDLVDRRVICRSRPPVPYDVLSIDIGSAPLTQVVPGALGAVVPVKPIGNFVARWNALVARVLATETPVRIGVVGAGAGGVEMVLAMRHGLRRRLREAGGNPDRLSFDLFADGAEVLPRKAPRVRAAFARVLAERGVRVHRGAWIDRVTPGALHAAGLTGGAEAGAGDGTAFEAGYPCVLHTADGVMHEFDEVLWVPAAGAQPWLAACGIDTDEAGFVAVHPTLESTSHPGVFAAGDCAAVLEHPREKAGVFAVRQGPALEKNLRRALRGLPPKPFVPQRRYLSLISTGDRRAVATRGGAVVLEGDWVWRWKDWIDRRFMRKFADLPDMVDDARLELPSGIAGDDAVRELSAIAMRCGGCGAKVGATVLARVMNDLKPVARGDVLIGLADPDDAAVVETPPGKVMVHTVDSFRAMIDDPYLFGRVAANHSLGDIFAMGGEPQTALAIATLPYGIESQVEDTLWQMMTGATEVLREAGCALVGGHTSEGAELALGFAVSGLIDRGKILRKGGMRPNDRLIVTKPLGTGTLFAADMRHKARGAWIAAALEMMQQSNRAGALCLHRHGASSCTDVTGFGLLGHLVEMVRASDVDVELDLRAMPVLPGALDTIAAGITSSLQPQNLRLRRAVRDLDGAADDPRWPLLFDPQTAGGLLASVPDSESQACVEELRSLGYAHTSLIGRAIPRSNALEPITLLR